jgi:hypothetical protein
MTAQNGHVRTFTDKDYNNLRTRQVKEFDNEYDRIRLSD